MDEAKEVQTPVDSLSLVIERSGRGDTVTVIAKLGDDELYRDKLDLNKASHRAKYGKAIQEKLPRFTVADVDSQLVKLLADLQRKEAAANEPAMTGRELAELELVRPELVFRPGFAGVSISRLMETRSGVDVEWTLYAKSGGKRTASELEPTIIAGDRALHVDPMPVPPPKKEAIELCGWSSPSREAWLRGDVRPTTAEVLRAVMQRIDRYVELPGEESGDARGFGATLSLWVMLSYCYPVFAAVPYLYLAGPAGSGKTRTMDVIARMVFRPMLSSNATGPTLFRSLHARGGTLLLDEAERLKDDRSPDVGEMNTVLLSGYRHGGRATRMERVGDGQFTPQSFDTFGPKLLACIRGLPPALSSRCITVRLSRAKANSPRASRRLDDSPGDQRKLRDLLHAWTLENATKLYDTPAPVSTLANRDAERWEPLLRIASLTQDAELVGVLLDHAARQLEVDSDDSTPEADPALLLALFQLVSDQLKVTPSDVLEAAREIDPDAVDESWNARRVGAVLRRYSLRTTRIHGRRVYRLTPKQVASVAMRYGYPVTESEAST